MPNNERRDTPGLGAEVLRAAQELGRADPIGRQTAADLVAAIREAARAENIKRDAGTWSRWGIGLAILILGAWWGMSNLFAERPTETRVERLIEQSDRQHPDSKTGIKANLDMLSAQQNQITEIANNVRHIKEAVDELKARKR